MCLHQIPNHITATVFIPFIDDLISSLTDRFLSHETTIISLQYILPEKCNVPYKHVEKSILFYKDDLPDRHEDTLKEEWCIWQRKWLLENEKTKTVIGALAKCDKRRFPNIAILLNILAVLPVSTATVEKTFLTLRRLKTYLRNSVGEDRIAGLALLSIHRDLSTEVSNEIFLNHLS